MQFAAIAHKQLAGAVYRQTTLTVARVPSSRLPIHHNCRLHMIIPKSPIAVVSEPNSCKHLQVQ